MSLVPFRTVSGDGLQRSWQQCEVFSQSLFAQCLQCTFILVSVLLCQNVLDFLFCISASNRFGIELELFFSLNINFINNHILDQEKKQLKTGLEFCYESRAHLMTQHWFFLLRRMLKKQVSAMAKTCGGSSPSRRSVYMCTWSVVQMGSSWQGFTATRMEPVYVYRQRDGHCQTEAR